jgi:glycosyltransferase involved in cell wall biosynthesis
MRILFVTNDRLGERRAGLAIRALELARVLSKHHEVTVASAQAGEMVDDGIRFIADSLSKPGPLRAAAQASDVVITQGLGLATFPFLRHARHLVVELYDPYLFEYLIHPHRSFLRWAYLRQWHLLNEQLLRGDFFICANERQWDYWLGRLCALGRLSPDQYRRDATFCSLLTVIPFGISPDPPRHTRRVVKGVFPGIASTDVLLLWGGGIWQWFDPLTLIRAMGQVSRERSDIKLLFLGSGHPSPQMSEMPIVAESRMLAHQLGVLGRSVFFNEGWVPRPDVQNYLLEADIGVSTYPDSAETRFSFRARVCDHIWAGLPMILTRGDGFADLVEQRRLGRTVEAGDVEGLSKAILDLADRPQERQEIHKRLLEMAPRFHWENVAEPLVRYCERPYRSPKASRWRQEVAPLLNWVYQVICRIGARLPGGP